MATDYEKKYKEVLEAARKELGVDRKEWKVVEHVLRNIFPELAESEDEKIRKIITDSVFYQYGAGVEYKDVLDYLDKLEKQKEQKPSTPKYKVGDVMRTKQESAEGITDGLPVIVSVDDNYYYCTNEKIPISEQEEYEFPPMNMRQKPAEVDERMKNDKHFLSICQHLETLISESKNEGAEESIDKDYRWLCEFYRKSRSASVEENYKKPAEWSEEDRNILLMAATVLKANFDSDEKFEGCDYDCETLAGKLLEMRYKS